MLKNTRLRLVLGWLVLLALILLFAAILRGRLHAQEEPPHRDEWRLALAVAKVAANEASLAHVRPAEVALVYQVVENRGSTADERLTWLSRHSSCVLTDRPMTEREARGNCRWSRNLRASSEQPVGWPENVFWNPYFSRRWVQVSVYAARLVFGQERFRPCAGTPLTWGGPMDHERARERGLRPLDCRDRDGQSTMNTGYALGSRL